MNRPNIFILIGALLFGGALVQLTTPAVAGAQNRAVADRLVEFGRMPARDARRLVRTVSSQLRTNARAGGDRYDRVRTAVGRAFLDGPGDNREEYEERLGQVLSRMQRGLDEPILEALFRVRPNAAVLCATDFEVTIIDCDALIAAASRNRAALPFTAPDDGATLKASLREARVRGRQANEIAGKLEEVMLGVPRILTRDRRGRGLLRLLESCPGGLNSRESQVRAWHVGPTEGMARCIGAVIARGGNASAARERAQVFFGMSAPAAEAYLGWAVPEASGTSASAAAPPPQPPPRRAAPSATDLLSQARAHFRANRYRQSAAAYEQVTRMDPTNSGAFAGLGSAWLHMRNARGAVLAYRQAVQLQPGNPNYHAFLGEALANAGDRANAAAEYQRALAIQPNNFIASQGLSRLGAQANRQQAQQNRRLSPDEQANQWRAQGRTHFQARRFPQAASAYEQAARLTPNHAGSHSGLGAARLSMGDTAGAVAAYQNCVRLDPNRSGYWSALARAQARSGDHQSAVASLQRALQLDPNNTNAQQGLAALGGRPARPAAQPAAAPPDHAGEPTHVGDQLPETPARDQIIGVMRPLQPSIASCVPGFSGRLTFSFSVAGQSGAVEAVTVAEEDQLELEEVECMSGVIGGASFPRFTREQLEISYPYML